MIRAARAALAAALFAALLPGRPAAAAAAPDGKAVLRLLDATRMDEAEAALPRVPASDPLRPFAEALLAFQRGDYAAAAAALPPEGGRDEAVIPWLRPRVAAARAATRDHLERTEQNFVYRFAPGADAVLVEYAIDALEGQRAAMARVLGVAPRRPVVVEFFPDVDAFVLASGLPPEWVETTNTVAICKWDRILVLSPMNMARGYPWKDTLAHEYVHLVLSRASGNQAPVWFQEGSAKVMEGYWRRGPKPGPLVLEPHAETLLKRARDADRLIPFADMHPSMAALPSADAAGLAFAEVAVAVDFLLAEAGEAGYRRVVEQTALHGDVMRALDEVLGVVGGGFEARWRRWLDGRPLVERAAIETIDPTLEAGAAGHVDDDEGLDPVLAAHADMRDLVRVGDLLRRRGHVEAALIEYGKAADAGPFHSPALANKRARALVALGRGPEARAILLETVALYPDYTPTVALLAELAAEAGDARAAERFALDAIAINPFDPGPHRVLLRLFEESGRDVLARREATVLDVLKTYVGP